MSAKFDWNQFEAVSKPEGVLSGFDWSQFEEVKKESKVPAMKREIGRAGKVIGSTVAGLPGDIASQVGKGLNWLAGVVPGGKPKTEEELSSLTESPFTSESIKGGIEKLAPSLVPASPEEKNWEDALGFLTSLAIPLPGGKAKALDPKKASQLFRFGRMAGLTEKELTPLLQGQMKTAILGKIASKTKGMEKTLDVTRNKLGDVYQSIGLQAANLPPLSPQANKSLATNLENIVKGWERTLKPSPDKQSSINFMQEAIGSLKNSEGSPEKLVNFLSDINSAVNWGAIRNGKKMLASVKDPIMKAISASSPSVAERLKLTNQLYSRLQDFKKSVGLKKINDFMTHDEASRKLVDLALRYGPATLLGATGHLVGGLKTAGATWAAKRGAAELLVNPSLQNLHRKMLTAIKNKSFSSSAKLLQAWKNLTGEEDPEEDQEES